MSVSFYFCVNFNIAILSSEKNKLIILSQWGGIYRNVSLAQYFTSACTKLIFLSYSHCPCVLGLLKLICILKQPDTYFVCQKCLNLIKSPFWSFPIFQRKINVLNPSYASIHSVSVTLLYSIRSLGTEKCHNNGYCCCNLIEFEMLEEL